MIIHICISEYSCTCIRFDRPSMSQGTVMIQVQNRIQEKDFTVATPEEFVHRFGGTRVINKVSICFKRQEFFTLRTVILGADRQQWYRGS